MHGDPKKCCFTYLYGHGALTFPFTRVSPTAVRVNLPGLNARFDEQIPYDERDQRVLVAFDGEIPWCGLPRSGDQQAEFLLDTLTVRGSQKRKPRPFELAGPYQSGAEDAHLPLVRRFILLPAGNALAMRYRPHSTTAWYAMIQILKHRDGKAEVEFITTDH